MDILGHLVDNRNMGQAFTLVLMFLLLLQFVVYLRLSKQYLPIIMPAIIITIEGIIFYSFVVFTSPKPSAEVTTLSWILRFQMVAYSVFLMKYLIRRKRAGL